MKSCEYEGENAIMYENLGRGILMHKKTIQLRQNILRESFLLFLKKGFEETTTREIAEACSIKQGSLYYHFEKKNDILSEIYGQFYSFLCEEIEKQFSDQEGAVMSVLSDILLYRVAMIHDNLFDLLISVIKDRELVRKKIDKTTETLCNNILSREYDKMHFALSMALGAEVELLLQVAKNELTLSPDELARWVAGVVLNVLGYSQEEAARLHGLAVKCADQFDIRAFGEKMEEKVNWFKLSDLRSE